MATFGYTTTGASQDNPADNVVWQGPYSPAADGTLNSLSFVGSQRLGPAATGALALYSGTTSAPTTLVVASGDPPVAVTSSTTYSQSFSQAIFAATHYWFCIRCPAYVGGGSPQNDIWVQFDGNTNTFYFQSLTSFPSTVSGASSATNEQWTIYGTYTAGGSQDTPELRGRPFGYRGQSQMQQLLAQCSRLSVRPRPRLPLLVPSGFIEAPRVRRHGQLPVATHERSLRA